MANVTINDLPAAGAITGTELVPVVQNGITVRTTTAALAGSPVQTQTFLTLNQEPTLTNSRSLAGGTGVGLTDGGAQAALQITLNAASGSLETAANGIIAKTSSNTVAGRTMASSTAGLSVTNGDGVAAAPTFALTGVALAVAGATGTGVLALNSSSTVATRLILGTAGQIDITDGNFVNSPVIAISSDPTVPGSGGIVIPAGTTGQRGTSTNGTLRYNTTSATFEGYANNAWGSIVSGTGVTSVAALTLGTTGTDLSSTVANPTTTPVITLNVPTASASNRGALSSADWTTFNNKGSGTVTSVTGTAPVASSGGTTPVISMPAATAGSDGYLTSTDWTTFNNKGSGTVTSVAAITLGTTGTDLSSTVATGTTTPVITLQVPTASASNRGALSSADWSTFNNKGSGSVTSVAATVPSIFSVSGSPITTSGTLAMTYSGTALPVANGGTGNATGTATINANLTGPITSVGNATSITAGAIVNADINAAAAIVDTKLATIATALKVSNSATTAASANTASAIVARDASGDFSAGTITAALTGTASGNLVSGGALGTPSSGTATNLTGLPLTTGVTGNLPVTNLNSGTSASILTFWRGDGSWSTPAGAGTVTSVAQSFTGGLISVAGSPITTSGTLALTVAGTSGGVPYFSTASTWATSAALAANALVIGGGVGAAPSTTTTGTGVVTALGVNTGTAGAFVVNGGALGTPLSGTATNITGLPLTTGVTGNLPVTNLNSGTSASASTFWRGDATWAAAGGSATLTISNKTSAYTVVAGDLGTVINCTSGAFTVSLTAAATLASGFNVTIWNTTTTGSDTITIDPSGAETIDGLATLILRQGEGMQIVCNGTNWETGNKKVMRAYADNFSATSVRPIAATSNSVAIGRGANSSGIAALAIGGYNATSSNDYTIAIGTSVTAAAGYSTAIGGNGFTTGAQTATGVGAMALGCSRAAGADSLAAAIANNTSSYGATAANSIAIGSLAKASAQYAYALAASSTASGVSSVATGYASTASGKYSYTSGGYSNSAQQGKWAHSSGAVATAGSSQMGAIVLYAATTGTAVAMTSDAAAVATTNQLIVATGQAMAFTGTIIGKQTGSANIAAYTIEGTVVNNGGTVTMPTGTLTAIGTPTAGWTAPTIAADNTRKGITLTSGFNAATTISWTARIDSSEILLA